MRDSAITFSIALAALLLSWWVAVGADQPLNPAEASHIVVAKIFMPAARVQAGGPAGIAMLERSGVVEGLQSAWYLLVLEHNHGRLNWVQVPRDEWGKWDIGAGFPWRAEMVTRAPGR